MGRLSLNLTFAVKDGDGRMAKINKQARHLRRKQKQNKYKRKKPTKKLDKRARHPVDRSMDADVVGFIAGIMARKH